MKEIIIAKKEEKQRLDKFLLKYINKASKAFLYKMLRKKRIKLNGKRAAGNEILADGDRITLYFSEETVAALQQERQIFKAERHFSILYEDENILAVSKPAGLLTHPENADERNTLSDQIVYYLYEKGEYSPETEKGFLPAVANRLDRNTSGVVLAGKNLPALQALNRAAVERRLDKLYYTIVKGRLSRDGVLQGYYGRDGSHRKTEVSKEEMGAEVLTKVRTLCYRDGYSLLEVTLLTGKTHQIRAHLAGIGHPVVGDRKYGDAKINQYFKEKYGLSNQFLHAHCIIYKQQEGTLGYLYGKSFTAPMPHQWRELVQERFPDFQK